MNVVRAITTHLAPGFPPVSILEGPRTCGKTYVAHALVAAGAWQGYESLADPMTFELARHDLPGWLASLPPTVVIDEAQLIDELPLLVKGLVDEPGTARRFLLTGSARLGRSALGGSDPLTGRVRRWTLAPLTAAEINGHADWMNRVVDGLFSGEIASVTPTASLDISERIEQKHPAASILGHHRVHVRKVRP